MAARVGAATGAPDSMIAQATVNAGVQRGSQPPRPFSAIFLPPKTTRLLYWVGGSGTWDDVTTTNWSLASGGAGGAAAPTASDDVTFDANSTSGTTTVTVNTGAVCQNFSVGGVPNTALIFTLSDNLSTYAFSPVGWGPAQRVLFQSSVAGTTRTITSQVQGDANANVDFMDITFAGPDAPFVGTMIGDCGGNSGVTFTASQQQTWSGNTTGNWNVAANWSARVPLPQDDVLINGLTSGTITFNVLRMGRNVDLTGSTGGTLTLISTASVFGNLTLAAGVTTSGATTFQMRGRGAQTINTHGVSISGQMSFYCPGGSYTLQAALTVLGTGVASVGLFVIVGSFYANGFNITTTAVQVASLALGDFTGVTVTLTGDGSSPTLWWMAATTLGVTPAAIVCTDTSATMKGLTLGNKTYPSFTLAAANYTITSSAVFLSFTAPPGATISVASGMNLNFTKIISNGTLGNLVTWASLTPGVSFNIFPPAGVGGFSLNYCSFKDVAASGATWWANNSTNVSGNSGITFGAPARTKAPTQAQSLVVAPSPLSLLCAPTQGQAAALVRRPSRTLLPDCNLYGAIGDFETWTAGLFPPGSGNAAVQGGIGYSGSHCLQITCGGTGIINTYHNTVPFGDCGVDPAFRYSFSVYVRAAAALQSFQLYIYWYDAAHVQIGLPTSPGVGTQDAVGAWTRVVFEGAVPPAGAAYALMTIRSLAVPANGDVHYFDAFQIVQGVVAPPYSALPGQFQAVARNVEHGATLTRTQGQTLTTRAAHARAFTRTQGQTLTTRATGARSLTASQGQTLTTPTLTARLLARSQSQTPTLRTTQARSPTASQSQTLATRATHARAFTRTQAQTLTTPTTDARSLSVSQGQTLTTPVSVARSLTRTQGQTLTTGATHARSPTASQGQTLTRRGAVARSLSASQTQARLIVRAGARQLALTQSQAGLVTSLKPPLVIALTGGQAATVRRGLSRAVGGTQAGQPSLARTLTRLAALTATQAATVLRLLARLTGATQAATTSLGALPHARTLSASQGQQSPTPNRSPSRVLGASQAAGGSVRRALARALPLTQAQAVSRRVALARVLGVLADQLASVSTPPPAGVFPAAQGSAVALVELHARRVSVTQTQGAQTGRLVQRSLGAGQGATATLRQLVVSVRVTAAGQAAVVLTGRGKLVTFNVGQAQVCYTFGLGARRYVGAQSAAPGVTRAAATTRSCAAAQVARLRRAGAGRFAASQTQLSSATSPHLVTFTASGTQQAWLARRESTTLTVRQAATAVRPHPASSTFAVTQSQRVRVPGAGVRFGSLSTTQTTDGLVVIVSVAGAVTSAAGRLVANGEPNGSTVVGSSGTILVTAGQEER